MSSEPPVQPVSASKPAPKKRRWLAWGCGGILAFILIIVVTAAITIWWIQRPIKPVVLSEKEKAVVEQKMEEISGGKQSSLAQSKSKKPAVVENRYVPGSTELRLTERELNGLLNSNTELGDKIRLELDRDAINAYLAVPIPEDFPIGGGRMFRARGRFSVAISSDAAPYAVLEDVTILGLSLPKEWLGGLKGHNLLADVVSGTNGQSVIAGVKSLRVVPGAIVLEVGK